MAPDAACKRLPNAGQSFSLPLCFTALIVGLKSRVLHGLKTIFGKKGTFRNPVSELWWVVIGREMYRTRSSCRTHDIKFIWVTERFFCPRHALFFVKVVVRADESTPCLVP